MGLGLFPEKLSASSILSPLLRTILLLIPLQLLPDTAPAHNPDIVHRGLTDEAFNLPIAGVSFYADQHPLSRADAIQGSFDEDLGTSWLGHFYNPVTGTAPLFAILHGPATQNAELAWNEARARYVADLFLGADGAFHSLGRVLHFIQDMTSPAHVHDDKHPAGDDFENWGPANFPGYDFSGVVPKFASDSTPAGLVHEVALLTYNLTAYQAELDEVAGAQPPSELSSMFPDGGEGGLHWDDGGFFGDAFWEIDRIGRFEDFAGDDAWKIVSENRLEDNGGRGGTRRLRGNAYIENTGGNEFGEPVPQVFNGTPNVAGRTLRRLYGDHLYREAVAYGAGLLQLFAQPLAARCGNEIHEPSEECDRGAANGTSGSCCNSDCTFKPPTAECRPFVGICDFTETCTGSSGTCPADLFAQPTVECRSAVNDCDQPELCTGDSPFCPPDAPKPLVCGDGIICGTEVCDPPGAQNGCPATFVCSPSCSSCFPQEECGNGNLELGEQCDGTDVGTATCLGEGFDCGAISCNPTCTLNTSACSSNECFPSGATRCLSLTTKQTCGNFDADVCLEWGANETCPCVAGSCSTTPVCGNGIVETGEQCDDGNTVEGDGCSPNCLTEFCGDGVRQPSLPGAQEECDGTDDELCPGLCTSACFCSGMKQFFCTCQDSTRLVRICDVNCINEGTTDCLTVCEAYGGWEGHVACEITPLGPCLSEFCGDVNNDGVLDDLDIYLFRLFLADPNAALLSPVGTSKCTVIGEASDCDILDLVVLRRALAIPALPPGIAPVCEAQTTCQGSSAYTITPIAIATQPAPQTGGGTFNAFQPQLSINNGGQVAFAAEVSGGSTGSGIFRFSVGSGVSSVALEGEPAPDTPGGSYAEFYLVGEDFYFLAGPSINDAGEIAFAVPLSGVPAGEDDGIFVVSSAGSGSARVRVGNAAPNPPGGSYDLLGQPWINNAGFVAFSAFISGGTSEAGIFVADPVGLGSARALAGQPAPDAGGQTYYILQSPPPVLNDGGEVAFVDFLGGASPGVFSVDPNGLALARALSFQPAPGTAGDSYLDPGVLGVSMNGTGTVAFRSSLLPAGGAAVFAVDRSGTGAPLARSGTPAPNTGGGSYSGFHNGWPVINDRGDVAFWAQISGGATSEGIFAATSEGVVCIVEVGDAVPGLPAVTITSFIPDLGGPSSIGGFNSAGQLAFLATLSDGRAGILLGNPRQE